MPFLLSLTDSLCLISSEEPWIDSEDFHVRNTPSCQPTVCHKLRLQTRTSSLDWTQLGDLNLNVDSLWFSLGVSTISNESLFYHLLAVGKSCHLVKRVDRWKANKANTQPKIWIHTADITIHGEILGRCRLGLSRSMVEQSWVCWPHTMLHFLFSPEPLSAKGGNHTRDTTVPMYVHMHALTVADSRKQRRESLICTSQD